jgi:hypothetical protein
LSRSITIRFLVCVLGTAILTASNGMGWLMLLGPRGHGALASGRTALEGSSHTCSCCCCGKCGPDCPCCARHAKAVESPDGIPMFAGVAFRCNCGTNERLLIEANPWQVAPVSDFSLKFHLGGFEGLAPMQVPDCPHLAVDPPPPKSRPLAWERSVLPSSPSGSC